MKRIQLVASVCLLCFPSLIWTQVVHKNFLTVNDGLSHRDATDLVQGQNGFLWIATQNGLNRFDGFNFLVYNNLENNQNRISENQILRIFQTNQGNLIIYYNSGYLEMLNPQTNRLSKISLDLKSSEKSIARNFYQSETGELYLISENDKGYYLFQYDDKKFKLLWEVKDNRSSNPDMVDFRGLRFHFFQENDGTYWILESENGLQCRNGQGKLLRQFNVTDFEGMQGRDRIPIQLNFMLKDMAGRIWISFAEIPGVYLYNKNKERFELPDIIPQQLHFGNAWTDKQGNVLFLNILDPNAPLSLWLLYANGQLEDYSEYMDTGAGFPNFVGNDFKKLFFHLSDSGVSKIYIKQSHIKNYLDTTLSKGTFGMSIRGIAEANSGNIIVATEEEGWYQLPAEGNAIEKIRFDGVSSLDLRPPLFCRNFVKDKQGYLWTSSYKQHKLPDIPKGYLLRYDPEKNTLKNFTSPKRIECLAISRSGKFWLPGVQTLLVFDPETEQFSEYQDADGTNPMQDLKANYVLESQDGKIWIATINGLLKIDPIKRKSFLITKQRESNKSSISDNNINTIYEDQKSRLWLGTTSGGVNLYDPATDSVWVYSESQGLANNTVCGILPEENGSYWISTYNGLSFFDSATKNFQNFYTSDGFSFNEFNKYSFFRDSRNRIYLGGMNGFNVFKSSDLFRTLSSPKLFFSEIAYFDKSQNDITHHTFGIQNLSEITLPAQNRYLHLKFGIDDYNRTDLNRFSYFLGGFDEGWHQIGNRNEVTFNNIPPGSYTLYLKGANHRGQWSEIRSMNIKVEEFFYKSSWFLFTVVTSLIGGIYAFYRYRLNQVIKLLKLRTKIASDLHDDVGGLLTGIAMQSEILELSKGELDKSRLSRLRELSQKAISQMRDVVWCIDARRDKVHDLLDRMNEHAEETLFPKGIQYRINTYHLNDEKNLPVAIRQNLFLIFKEAITNIIRHSKATKVEVKLSNQGSVFEMHIRDNGIGVPKNLKPSGLGLANIKMRAEQIGATVEFQSNNNFAIVLKRPAI